jgi:hypothetical protein
LLGLDEDHQFPTYLLESFIPNSDKLNADGMNNKALPAGPSSQEKLTCGFIVSCIKILCMLVVDQKSIELFMFLAWVTKIPF